MNRTRALLLVAAVPLIVVLGLLASAVLGSGGSDVPPEVARTSTQAPRSELSGIERLAREFTPAGAVRVDVGSGARGAAIFRARDAAGPGPVVVFLHGWTAIDPAIYGPWIAHLVRGGATVIYPAYQEPPYIDVVRPLPNALVALNAAFAKVELEPGRLVVAGHSAGGALAADIAASARAAGLPPADAVFSVYPGRTLPGAGIRIPLVDAGRIPSRTPLLVLAGADDRVVGDRVARQIARTARRARTTLRIVRDAAVDDHGGPTRDDDAARRQFWAPLDRLLAATG